MRFPYALRFSGRALLVCGLLFGVELLIALFFRTSFVRFFVGDVLVIPLMYAFLRIFLKGPVLPLSLGLLGFACLVEIGQYFELVKRLGLEGNQLARIVIGATFDWHDLLAYALGTALILAVEQWRQGRLNQTP